MMDRRSKAAKPAAPTKGGQVLRGVDRSGSVSFAGTTYRVGNRFIGQTAGVRLVGDTVQITDEATRAWNIHAALYYKAGGSPWRMPREATHLASCFVGISFYRTLDRKALHTAMAQVFNERGDGVVVRGGPAKISKDDRQPHL